MKSTRLLWKLVGISGLMATLLLIFGFFYGTKTILYPSSASLPAEKPPTVSGHPAFQDSKIQIVALGDSLSKGTGDVTGQGYVGDLSKLIAKDTGKPTYVIGNLAVNGYTSAQLLQELQDNQGITEILSKADIITLTVGGDDLFHLGQDVVDPAVINQRMPAALKRVKLILTKLHAMNPQAEIFYIGLYNPFQDLPNSAQVALSVEKWNSSVFDIVSGFKHMTFVPTYDLFAFDFKKFLYTDHFHPNQEGYMRIAERVLQVLKPILPQKGGASS